MRADWAAQWRGDNGVAAVPSHPPPSAVIACVRDVTEHSIGGLLQAVRHLTPRIEQHHDALVLDLAGCERLLLADDATSAFRAVATRDPMALWPVLAARLYNRLAGATSDRAALRVGLGPTRTAAWLAAAGYAGGEGVPSRVPWRVLPTHQVPSVLDSLPLAVLLQLPDVREAPGVAQVLVTLAASGVRVLGHLSRLPRTALYRRFGRTGPELADLAAGADLTPLRVTPEPAWLGARLRFDPPTTLDQVGSALDHLAAFLAQRLGAQRQEASEIRVVVRLEDRLPWRAARRLGQATASRAALLDHARRLLGHLEVARAPHAVTGLDAPTSISIIHLRVGGLRVARPRQATFWPPPHALAARQAAERLAGGSALLGRTGRPQLWRAVLAAPHAVLPAVLPEERYALQARCAS